MWLVSYPNVPEDLTAPPPPPPPTTESAGLLAVTTPHGKLYPPPDDPYRDPGSLARTLTILLMLSTIADAAAAITDALFLQATRRAQRGELTVLGELTSAENANIGAGAFQGLVVLVTGIVFLVWFRRLYRNLGGLGVERLRYKAGWAIGGWFVPILGLVRPKAIANDIWRASDSELPAKQEGPGFGRPVWSLINWWWALWLLSGRFGFNSLTLSEAETLDELSTQTTTFLFADSLSVILDVLAFLMVRGMTVRQQARWQSLQSQAIGTEPPSPPLTS